MDRIDRHDATKSRFSQFCELAYKQAKFQLCLPSCSCFEKVQATVYLLTEEFAVDLRSDSFVTSDTHSSYASQLIILKCGTVKLANRMSTGIKQFHCAVSY